MLLSIFVLKGLNTEYTLCCPAISRDSQTPGKVASADSIWHLSQWESFLLKTQTPFTLACLNRIYMQRREIYFLMNWVDTKRQQKPNKTNERFSKLIFSFPSQAKEGERKKKKKRWPLSAQTFQQRLPDTTKNMVIPPQNKTNQSFSWRKKIISEPTILSVKWIIFPYVPHLLYITCHFIAQSVS